MSYTGELLALCILSPISSYGSSIMFGVITTDEAGLGLDMFPSYVSITDASSQLAKMEHKVITQKMVKETKLHE